MQFWVLTPFLKDSLPLQGRNLNTAWPWELDLAPSRPPAPPLVTLSHPHVSLLQPRMGAVPPAHWTLLCPLCGMLPALLAPDSSQP